MASIERGFELTMAVDSFSSAISNQGIFRQDGQIPEKIKVKMQNANLPEPIWRNTPVFFKIIYKSIFLIPRSHFGHFLPLLSWLDNASGTLHLAVDLRLQSSRFSRCNGWMVIEFMFAGLAARLRIRSTSFSGPENPRLAVWLEIGFELAS